MHYRAVIFKMSNFAILLLMCAALVVVHGQYPQNQEVGTTSNGETVNVPMDHVSTFCYPLEGGKYLRVYDGTSKEQNHCLKKFVHDPAFVPQKYYDGKSNHMLNCEDVPRGKMCTLTIVLSNMYTRKDAHKAIVDYYNITSDPSSACDVATNLPETSVSLKHTEFVRLNNEDLYEHFGSDISVTYKRTLIPLTMGKDTFDIQFKFPTQNDVESFKKYLPTFVLNYEALTAGVTLRRNIYFVSWKDLMESSYYKKLSGVAKRSNVGHDHTDVVYVSRDDNRQLIMTASKEIRVSKFIQMPEKENELFEKLISDKSSKIETMEAQFYEEHLESTYSKEDIKPSTLTKLVYSKLDESEQKEHDTMSFANSGNIGSIGGKFSFSKERLREMKEKHGLDFSKEGIYYIPKSIDVHAINMGSFKRTDNIIMDHAYATDTKNWRPGTIGLRENNFIVSDVVDVPRQLLLAQSEKQVMKTKINEYEKVTEGLLGSYYKNRDGCNQKPNVEPFFSRIDRVLDYNYGDSSPFPHFEQRDNFSGCWLGFLNIKKAGTFRFIARGDDWIQLLVDGANVNNEDLKLDIGHYPVQLSYCEHGGKANWRVRAKVNHGAEAPIRTFNDMFQFSVVRPLPESDDDAPESDDDAK